MTDRPCSPLGWLTLSATLIIAPFGSLDAQPPDSATLAALPTNTRLRVTMQAPGGGRVFGNLFRVGSDSVVLEGARGDTAIAFSLGGAKQIDRFAGRRSTWAFGMGIGAGAGLVLGTLAGVFLSAGVKFLDASFCSAVNNGTRNPSCEQPVTGALVAEGAGAGLLAGAAVGMAVGALMRTDRWQRVPSGHALTFGLAPSGSGVALRGTLRF